MLDETLAASARQDLVVLDVCKLHPLRRIRNGVISRSWSTDRSFTYALAYSSAESISRK